MKVLRRGKVFKPENETKWWSSHAMAPTPIEMNDRLRVFLGCWDSNNISRIGYVDLDKRNLTTVLEISNKPILEIGDNGCFDDNGVFPAHATVIEGKCYLYYTGFQKLDKIPFSNFSGLALSDDFYKFERVSKAPVMDRKDEGLFTRAGTSVIKENGEYISTYSCGSDWMYVNGKERPVYEVFLTISKDGILFPDNGVKIVSCDFTEEHGLGRPQIIKWKSVYIVFFTVRKLNYSYSIGMAYSFDLITWVRKDELLKEIYAHRSEFDKEMVYFPAVIDINDKLVMFYSGNKYGKDGLGYVEFTFSEGDFL